MSLLLGSGRDLVSKLKYFFFSLKAQRCSSSGSLDDDLVNIGFGWLVLNLVLRFSRTNLLRFTRTILLFSPLVTSSDDELSLDVKSGISSS